MRQGAFKYQPFPSVPIGRKLYIFTYFKYLIYMCTTYCVPLLNKSIQVIAIFIIHIEPYKKSNQTWNVVCKLTDYSWHRAGYSVADRTACRNCSTSDMLPVVNISCVLKFASQCIVVLLGMSLPDYTLPNASRTLANDFHCEAMLRNEHTFCLWMHSARTCAASAQLTTAAA
jgi:hypothetical protein